MVVREVSRALEGEEVLRGDDREYKLREFRVEDLDKVVSINREVLPENYPPFFFLEHHMCCPKAFIVAEVEGEVVGYVMSRVEFGWSLIEAGKPTRKGHIISIGVLPKYRRIGIGYNLMVRALRALKKIYKVSEVYLEVRVSNAPAISLYKKLGFEIARVYPRYYHDGEDAYIMVIDLRKHDF